MSLVSLSEVFIFTQPSNLNSSYPLSLSVSGFKVINQIGIEMGSKILKEKKVLGNSEGDRRAWVVMHRVVVCVRVIGRELGTVPHTLGAVTGAGHWLTRSRVPCTRAVGTACQVRYRHAWAAPHGGAGAALLRLRYSSKVF